MSNLTYKAWVLLWSVDELRLRALSVRYSIVLHVDIITMSLFAVEILWCILACARFPLPYHLYFCEFWL